MSEFPDENEEFELMYGDELELLRDQEDPYEPLSKSRKSLDFNSPSTSRVVEKENTNPNLINTQLSQNNEIFENDFHPIPNDYVSQVPSEQGGSRKRSIQDLFGDIDDILNEDQVMTKKHKGDKLEEDLALIDHILQLRKLAKEKDMNLLSRKDYTTNYKERDKYNLSYNVPNYPFIAITRPDKERVYVRCHSEAYEKEETDRILKENSSNNILGDASKQIWEGAIKLLSQQDAANAEVIIESDVEVVQKEEQLWVDLYKPRKYLELLSDESTNRVMLKWIKLWDKIVFNRRPRIKQVKQEEKPGKKKFFQREQLITELDEHGRPHHKIALLCGPPGLGKTTLAHMVAKHAGYNVVEINASDDRSTEAFKTSLENTTQMRSVVDQDKRPNCLVFDEIDGAPQASIDFLIKFVNGTAVTKAKKGAKQKKPSILRRPIICICNDAYAATLRPLKQIAFVVNFPQTSSARLAERLMEIAKRQGVKTYQGAMLALAEKSHNDIRSCLSVLHFFKAKNKPVTLADVYRSNVGQKDIQKGLFSVWEDIFRISAPKTVPGQNVTSTNDTLTTRMKKVLETVSSFGDYDRVAQGVFENYPAMKFKDNNMENTCLALEWFGFSDLVSKQIHTLQNYSLSCYLQFAFVEWHFVFASKLYQKISYPSQGYEAKVKGDRHKAVLNEVLRGMTPGVRAYCQKSSLILDILPMLSRIIVPPLRPVSLHLYTPEEKNELLKVVNIMIDYNLNYVQERTAEGTYVYNLDPNIYDIVTFEINDSQERRALSYPNKQLISREIEMEKMRRLEQSKTSVTNIQASPNTSNKPASSNTKGPMRVGEGQEHLPNHLQTLKARQVKTKAAPGIVKDFFGRIIKQPVSTPEKTGKKIINDIWYQYKEGYNNAVRKNIKISSLK